MTTTLTRTDRMMAVLDFDTPTYADDVENLPDGLRAPDFVERERAYWIGPEATVSCWLTADMDGIVERLERAGWMARTGAHPSRNGLIVEPHNPDVTPGPLMRNGVLFTLWEMARETLLVTA